MRREFRRTFGSLYIRFSKGTTQNDRHAGMERMVNEHMDNGQRNGLWNGMVHITNEDLTIECKIPQRAAKAMIRYI
jgi:hypothetical protein